MDFKNIPPWLWVLGFIIGLNILAHAPGLIIVLILGYSFYRIFQSLSEGSKNDFADLLNDELKDFFHKKKKEKVITVNKKISKPNFSFSSKMPSFSPVKAVLFSFFGIIAFLFILDGFVDVKPGYVAVIFDRGRGVLKEPLQEGLHLKIPFWQEATKFQTKKQEFTMAGEYQGTADIDGVRGRSKDGQDVFADVTVTYQILPEDAPVLRKQFIDERGYKITIVQPAARSVVYDAIGKFNALELISDKRSAFTDFIAESLKKIYGENHIQFREIFVRKITFSPEFASAIEEKQIAEQRIKTAENRKLEAEQLKEKTIIEAEAEAESITLKGNALRENPEVIQLQFVEKMAPQINWGILPDGALPLIDLKNLQQ